MLISLDIRQIALLSAVSLEPGEGLTVLTGETGAGKSILVDALSLVLGGRADRELIRAGEDKASVEALFDISQCAAAQTIADELGVDCSDGVLALRRDLQQSGRSVCRVGGVAVPLSTMQNVASHLMDIHGQHEHQSLLDEKRHAAFLDALGDADHQALCRDARARRESLLALRRDIAARKRDLDKREARRKQYLTTVRELEQAALVPGQERELEDEAKRLRAFADIQLAIETAYHAVYLAEGAHESALSLLRKASRAMEGIAELDSRCASVVSQLDALYYEAEEAGLALRALRPSEDSPERLEAVEARLDELRRLERRYGADETEMLSTLAEAKQALEDTAGQDEAIKTLEAAFQKDLAAFRGVLGALEASRRAAAAAMEQRMARELAELGMGGARFTVIIEPAREAENADGVPAECAVAFHIAPNPGEPPRPLAKTASGGELSRLMLALKAISAEQDGVPSMVFDEIDTGVSGRMAQAVAEKMARIARTRQVFCVTHLHQLAAMADTHILIEKYSDQNRTFTRLRQLDTDGREREIARMLGGAQPASDTAITHARTLLKAASDIKEHLT